MSRDLTPEEQQKFSSLYGAGQSCKNCGNEDVTVKIWEKYGSDAHLVGGDLGPEGVVGAIVACDSCSHAETVDRSRILAAGGGAAAGQAASNKPA